MKENTREISILKRRLLEYLDFKGISKYECYKNTGITNGVLSQANGLSEDNLMRFLSYYTDISYQWLFAGNGSMLKQNVSNDKNLDNTLVPNDKDTSNNRIKQEETSFIYKMYQEEKADWKAEKKEKDAKIDQLQSELRAQSAELAALKAKYQDKESGFKFSNPAEDFTGKPSGDSGEDYSPAKLHTTSVRSSAGKI